MIPLYLPPSDAAPSWSSDTNFPAGASAWSATPTKVVPSGGQIAGGFVPATKPPATWINWLLATVGSHVRANSGWHVLNWRAEWVQPGNFTAQYAAQRVPACTVQSAASGGLPVIMALDTLGKTHQIYREDAALVTTAVGPTGAASVHAIAAGNVAGTITLAAVTNAAGTVYKSVDKGETWTTPSTLTATAHQTIAWFATAAKWIYAVNAAGRIKYSPDLVTWTTATGAGGAPTTPRKIETSATTAITIYDTSATVCARSLDAVNWTLQTLSAAVHDWRGVAYNSVTSLWMAIAHDSKGAYSSDDGLSWTEFVAPAGAVDVAAFGRYFVVLITGSHSIGSSIAVSEDSGATWNEFLIDSETDGSENTGYTSLLVFDGRIVALGRNTINQLKMAFSLRAPWMPTP